MNRKILCVLSVITLSSAAFAAITLNSLDCPQNTKVLFVPGDGADSNVISACPKEALNLMTAKATQANMTQLDAYVNQYDATYRKLCRVTKNAFNHWDTMALQAGVLSPEYVLCIPK